MTDSKLVPWQTSENWLTVYDLIFVQENYSKALKIINYWTARQEKISWGVSCTKNFLAIKSEMAQDDSDAHDINFVFYQNALASAISNFVGLALEKLYKTHKTSSSMQFLADKIGIESWIVDLRHEISHGELPELPVLQEAGEFCFDWLRKNYWDDQKSNYLQVSLWFFGVYLPQIFA